MSDAFDKQFLELQKIFIGNLPERKQRINAFYLALNSNRLDKPTLENLHREVHNLAGAAGCYQLTNLAEEARLVEDHLSIGADSEPLQSDCWWQALENFIAHLSGLLDGASPSG